MAQSKAMITTDPISPDEWETELNDPRCGATVTFTGRVRNHHKGRDVLHLHYEAYLPMAELELIKVAIETEEKFDVARVLILHRIGALAIGDVAVWIGVESGHRGDGFKACKYAIDTLKRRVPIWKKEFYADGTTEWVACHCVGNNHEDAHQHG